MSGRALGSNMQINLMWWHHKGEKRAAEIDYILFFIQNQHIHVPSFNKSDHFSSIHPLIHPSSLKQESPGFESNIWGTPPRVFPMLTMGQLEY